jgi:hypothetical protein
MPLPPSFTAGGGNIAIFPVKATELVQTTIIECHPARVEVTLRIDYSRNFVPPPPSSFMRERQFSTLEDSHHFYRDNQRTSESIEEE